MFASSFILTGTRVSPSSSKTLTRFNSPRQRKGITLQSALQKQYMSSATKPKKIPVEPRPSASVLLISPKNEILLLHRVKSASAFSSAHVFPGGNVSPAQDGEIPPPSSPNRHEDGRAYRIGAIRECFEESGILLAKRGDGSGELVEILEQEREKARKDIYRDETTISQVVEARHGYLDTESLIPFTRWITPTNIPRRFSTQMYIYFLPLSRPSPQAVIPMPTSDGGIEHTTAQFAPCSTWLDLAQRNQIILFPPQFYLMHLLSPHLPSNPPNSTMESLQAQRDSVMRFLAQESMTNGKSIKWADKCMCPTAILMRKSDGRSVLALDKPGPELAGSGRGGDDQRVVLVKFSKDGPRDVEIRWRKEILEDERRAKL